MMSKLTILAGALAALAVHGGVYDDALIWYRGGSDANGDGVLQAGEFVDSAHAKSETAFQTCTISGSGTVGYAKGAVWSAYNPLATNTQHYLSFPNGDAADETSCVGMRAVNPYAETDTNATNYTIHLRFRWDGKIPPAASDNTMILFDTGVSNWSQSGLRMGLKYFAETEDFGVYWLFGTNADKTDNPPSRTPTATDGVKLVPGEWNDWFLAVRDYGMGRNAEAEVYRASPGKISGYSEIFFRYPWLSVWQKGNQWFQCCSIKMGSGSKFNVATSSFSGDIAAWTFWPRKLSVEEMRQVAASVRPGDALFRLGVENGSAREFAAEGQGAAVVDVEGSWDVVPASVKAGDTLQIVFPVDAQFADKPQVLRVKAASGNSVITAQIATYDRTTQTADAFTTLSPRQANANHDALFFVPKELLTAGDHVVKLTFKGDLAFDVIELAGSWRLGDIDWRQTPFTRIEASSNATNGYDLATGYWVGMDSSLSADGAPLTDASTTIRFNVPADMVACSRKLEISLNQCKTHPEALLVYANDTLVHEVTSNLWQYCVYSCAIPSSALVAGENVLRVRRVSSEAKWWGNARGYTLMVLDAPNPYPLSTILTLR